MMAAERCFVDVSVTRIHAYVGRSTKLRSIRGASSLLAAATERSTIEDLLMRRWPSGCVSICDEAGEAESIVHLELICTCGGCAADQVAVELLTYLRTCVPASSLRCAWGHGVSYSEFVAAPEDWVEAPSPEVDIPILEVCHLCQHGYASTTLRAPDGSSQAVCIDCDAREEFGRKGAGRGPATRLIARLEPITGNLELSDDLEMLAMQGPTQRRSPDDEEGRTLKRNQLALVYVDGNRFGSMFAGAREAAALGFSIDQLSRGLGEVLWGALARAAGEVQQHHGDGVLIAEPVIAAADDLCVMMPAAAAWEFVDVFCAEFATGAESLRDRAAENYTGSAKIRDLVPAPTASAGVVFAHMKKPFLQSLELAEELLALAKRAVSGKEATVMWIDCSREGHEVPPGRRPLALASISLESGTHERVLRLDETMRRVLDDASGWSTSLRRNLASLAHTQDRDGAAEEIRRMLQRNGHFERGEGAVARFWESSFDPALMVDVLSIAEWWNP